MTTCQPGAFLYMFGKEDGPCKVGVTVNPASRAQSITAYLPGSRLGRGATMIWQSVAMERGRAEHVERVALNLLAGQDIRVDKQPWQRWRTEWFQISSDQAIDAIRRAFESAGVEFISENGGGAGVRLRKPAVAE